MKGLGKATLFLLLWVGLQPLHPAAAGVLVFDAATAVGTPVVIKIQTRGKVFSAGGQRAEVSVDKAVVDSILTGADGFGYLKYVPARPGVLAITARSGEEAGRGFLLAAGPEDPVLVVEIDGPIRQLPKLTSPVDDAADSLRSLSSAFRIVYVAGMLGPAVDRAWLASVDMPESVVLSGKKDGLLKRLKVKGIDLRAVVGSQALLDAAKTRVPHRFGFETDEKDLRVKNWKELEKKLRKLI
jgi:hypothetical protein